MRTAPLSWNSTRVRTPGGIQERCQMRATLITMLKLTFQCHRINRNMMAYRSIE